MRTHPLLALFTAALLAIAVSSSSTATDGPSGPEATYLPPASAVSGCWLTEAELANLVTVVCDSARAYKPPFVFCESGTMNEVCKAACRQAWDTCHTTAADAYCIALQKAVDDYFDSTYDDASDELASDLALCIALHENDPVALWACYRAAQAVFCATWTQAKDDTFEADVLAAATAFTAAMATCDSTYIGCTDGCCE